MRGSRFVAIVATDEFHIMRDLDARGVKVFSVVDAEGRVAARDLTFTEALRIYQQLVASND